DKDVADDAQAVPVARVHLRDHKVDEGSDVEGRVEPSPALGAVGQGFQLFVQHRRRVRLVGVDGGTDGDRVRLHAVPAGQKFLVFAVAQAVDAPVLILQVEHHRLIALRADAFVVEIVVPEAVDVKVIPAAVAGAFQGKHLVRRAVFGVDGKV